MEVDLSLILEKKRKLTYHLLLLDRRRDVFVDVVENHLDLPANDRRLVDEIDFHVEAAAESRRQIHRRDVLRQVVLRGRTSEDQTTNRRGLLTDLFVAEDDFSVVVEFRHSSFSHVVVRQFWSFDGSG